MIIYVIISIMLSTSKSKLIFERYFLCFVCLIYRVIHPLKNECNKISVIDYRMVYLHCPNQFIWNKKSDSNLFIIYTHIHNMYIKITMQKKAHTKNETHRNSFVLRLRCAAIFCEVSAKPNYQNYERMNMIGQERRKNP